MADKTGKELSKYREPGNPGFAKGNPGRPKGAPNKFKLTSVRDYFKNQEIDLVAHIAGLIQQLPIEAQVNNYIKLLSWVEPRTQKIENIGERDQKDSTGMENKTTDELLQSLRNTIIQNERINRTRETTKV